MDILTAIIMAIVQGLTEFLPVSSSGHLALVQHFADVSSGEGTFLSVVMHLGTLVAVFIAFRKTIWELILEFFRMVKDIFAGKFRFKEMNEYRRMIVMLIVSTIPLACLLPFYGKLSDFIGQPSMAFLGVCFLLTSILLYISDRVVKGEKTAKDMSYKNALAIGITQCAATLPGISRSGSTVATSLICGLSKKFAVQFSFILGIPAILGAGVMEAKDVLTSDLQIEWLPVIIGFVVSAVVGFFAIKMVAWLLKSDRYRIFAYYTMTVGVIALGIGIFEMIVR